MRQMVRSQLDLGRQIAAEYLSGPHEIDNFLRSVWFTVPDPHDAELIRSPQYQTRLLTKCDYFAGDCDDAAVMAAVLLAAFGVQCWFVAIRMPEEPDFSHVFVRAMGFGDIDPTTPERLLPIAGFVEAMAVEV